MGVLEFKTNSSKNQVNVKINKKKVHHHCWVQDAAREKAFSERTVLIQRLKNLKHLGQVFWETASDTETSFLRVRSEYQVNFSIVGHPIINSLHWKCPPSPPPHTPTLGLENNRFRLREPGVASHCYVCYTITTANNDESDSGE